MVLDVASAAPDGSETWVAGSSAESWTSTCQPAAGRRPEVAMSPPRLTSTPVGEQVGDLAGGPVGGRRLGRGTQVELHPRPAW